MTLRAILACALVLAAGCGRKQSEDAPAAPPAPPAPQPPAPPDGGGSQFVPRAPAANAQPGNRCRAAIDRTFAASRIPDKKLVEKLASILTEACQSDGWSDEVLTCVERAKDADALATCKPTSAQQESLRARLVSRMGSDGGISIAGGPGVHAAPESETPSALELRLRGYAKLLAIDISILQLIEAYPGAPTGTTFQTWDYKWRRQTWLTLDAMQKEVDAILASTSETPSTSADAAVHPYADTLARWMPRLLALVAYYEDQKFVDDEFDRGRKEAPDVRRTAAELAKLRAPMRGAVLAAWRDLVADYRDSPRAVVAHAWIACMSIADRVMEQAKPEAITKVVSECRRSIPRITELPSIAGFDTVVRGAAIELGDWVAQHDRSWQTSICNAIGQLTQRYIELWPKLPTTPAEKPAP
ncbi:MAG TPA: hypothetical protein VN253_27345 [Kofleriaceae bacterium]|nr:hypothetical protein [Kofleriaceae bacterium]